MEPAVLYGSEIWGVKGGDSRGKQASGSGGVCAGDWKKCGGGNGERGK